MSIWWLVESNVPVRPIRGAFTLNGIQYPGNWLALAPLAEKHALGIYEQRNVEGEPPQPWQWTEVFAFNSPEGFVDRTFNKTLPDLANTLKWKRSKLDEYRKQREDAGLTIPGVGVVQTDAEGKARATEAMAHLGRKPGKTVKTKLASGWVTLNKAQVEALHDSIGDYCSAVADAHYAHDQAIQALGTSQAVIDYDFTTGWPANGA